MELFGRLRTRGQKGSRRPLSLHTKLTLATTAVFLVAGTVLLLAAESNAGFAEYPATGTLLAAFFQSVTARTAGFNTVDLRGLSSASILVLMIFMVVGASPASTGGGIKTTTAAVLFAVARARLAGRETVTVFRRTIPEAVIVRAVSITVLAIVLIGVSTLALAFIQSGGEPDPATRALASRACFIDHLFEAVSAFATVGLSLGATRDLNTGGKLLITVLMLVGRVGPLTMAVAAARQRGAGDKLAPAEEGVMIG
jgi:trk system potassium uptake protein TrkH